MRVPRILMVDDNRAGLAARRWVLTEQGYHVLAVADPVEAWEIWQAAEWDLLVTDYRMPGMDGLELIRRVLAVSPRARVVLLSGFVEALGFTPEATGADVVLMKCASEVEDLLREVERLAGGVRRKPMGWALELDVVMRTRRYAR